jgi:hypothetical protein
MNSHDPNRQAIPPFLLEEEASEPFSVIPSLPAPAPGFPFSRLLFGASVVTAGLGAASALGQTHTPVLPPGADPAVATAIGWVEFLRLGPLALAVLGGWWGMRKDEQARQAQTELVLYAQKTMGQLATIIAGTREALARFDGSIQALTRELERRPVPTCPPPSPPRSVARPPASPKPTPPTTG